jgi:hypothetical protein
MKAFVVKGRSKTCKELALEDHYYYYCDPPALFIFLDGHWRAHGRYLGAFNLE